MTELVAKVDSLDNVPEEYKDLYTEAENGGYIANIKPKDGFELADTSTLTKALKSERSRAKELEKEIKSFDGLDAESAKRAVERLDAIEKGKYDLDEDEVFQKKLKAKIDKMAEKHKEETESLKSELSSIKGELQKRMIDNRILEEAEKRNADGKLLLPHFRPRMKIEELKTEEGKRRYNTVILDESGEPEIDGQDNPVGVGALFDEYEEIFPNAFKGPDSSGSGSHESESGGGTSGVKKVNKADKEAVSQNLEGIASGEVEVVNE